RGTVFHTIATILREKKPAFLLLENVGNFAKHDGGNTWSRVRKILEDDLGYDIVATEHVSAGSSSGLISPHHFGYPHHRERFFVIGQRKRPIRSDSAFVRELLQQPLSKRLTLPANRASTSLASDEGKKLDAKAKASLVAIISAKKAASESTNLIASQLSSDRVRCINHWAKLLKKLDALDQMGAKPSWRETMPSFPIWGYELDPWHWYPISKNPSSFSRDFDSLADERRILIKEARGQIRTLSNYSVDLRDHPPQGERAWLSKPLNSLRAAEWIDSWPGYAGKREEWPSWKQRFIRQNREWAIKLWSSVDPAWLRAWLDTLYDVIRVPSNQKLEWNCKGEDLDIRKHILQFRPSGLRVKRLAHVPALVAMTTTQVPIVPRMNHDESTAGAFPGAHGRHLIPSEALQLQGFPRNWVLPVQRERAFTCFGNAVHVGVVHQLVANWLFESTFQVS
ncbi:MAG: DNA cytosine methyltransferase, partial [Burkholderiaceae bacterium]|nr:DNA cytosine methyltransferase [Burkholderiaceae bacterium]